MTDTIDRLLKVLDLAEVHAGLRFLREIPPLEEYVTTNQVFTVGAIVAKCYRVESAYLVEKGILSNSSSFSFMVPELLFSHESRQLGNWILMSQVKGSTLDSSRPSVADQPALVEMMVSALVEFEHCSHKMLAVAPVRWRWMDSMQPLITALAHDGHRVAADVLLRVAAACDVKSDVVEAVPCFDLFARNVIWTGSGAELNVTFIDFDKANRLVPAGEQLSHIAMIPALQTEMNGAIAKYASLTGRPLERVKHVVDISCFFRSLSNVRDSLPQLSLGRRDGRDDPYADERSRNFHVSIAEASRYNLAISTFLSEDGVTECALDLLLTSILKLKVSNL